MLTNRAVLLILLGGLGCAEPPPTQVIPSPDAGTSAPPPPPPDAGAVAFRCPDPLLPTTILDAGPLPADADPDNHHAPRPPLVPETCWEATPDWRDDYVCDDPDWQPGACGDGVRIHRPGEDRNHIYLPEPIVYPQPAPSGGNHRPSWSRWGEYTFLPPQWWLHNLEHGGAAFLYHPCASDELKEAMRAYIQARPDDDGGLFRWIMTPAPGLRSAMAVVTWEHKLSANCLNGEDIDWFLRLNYRQAPEDVELEGRYIYTWQRR